MYTECPRCHALYRITRRELEAAEGWVRCGECGHIFNAHAGLSDPEAGERATMPAAADLPEHEPLSAQPLDELLEAHDPEREPPSPRKRRWRALLWSLASLLLLGGIGFLYFYDQGVAPTQSAVLRPVLEPICRLAGCTLPPRRDLKAIAITHRDIFTDPTVPHALRVTATLVNRAPFPQPYPRMLLRFYNIDGQEIARGRFTPAQYLPPGISPKGLMPVDKPIKVHFVINDPGQKVLAFEFTLLP